MTAELVFWGAPSFSWTKYSHDNADRTVVDGFEQHGLSVAFGPFGLQGMVVSVPPTMRAHSSPCANYLVKCILDVLFGNASVLRSPDSDSQETVLLRARRPTRCATT